MLYIALSTFNTCELRISVNECWWMRGVRNCTVFRVSLYAYCVIMIEVSVLHFVWMLWYHGQVFWKRKGFLKTKQVFEDTSDFGIKRVSRLHCASPHILRFAKWVIWQHLGYGPWVSYHSFSVCVQNYFLGVGPESDGEALTDSRV